MADWNALIDLCKGHTVYIQTHNYPDPDAVASGLGLQRFLELHGIDSRLCYDGSIDKLNTRLMLDYFKVEVIHANQLLNMSEDDYIITVDSQKYNANLTDLPGEEVGCIDHHPTFIPCEYQYKDVRITGACATLIAQYFKESNTPMDTRTATALIYGIRVDTNNLLRGVTALDIEMYEYLFEYLDQGLLARMYNSTLELSDLQAYGAAIENIRIFDNVGFAQIPFDCADALVAMVADFILGIAVVEFCVVYCVRADGLKLSVRSEVSSLNAGLIIRRALDGIGLAGGHATMAGGFIAMPDTSDREAIRMLQIEDRFEKAIQELKTDE